MVVGMGAVTERTLAIADAVTAVAKKLERTPAEVAVAWTLCSDAVAAPIVGARTLAQLEDNLGALDVSFPRSYASSSKPPAPWSWASRTISWRAPPCGKS